MTSTLPQEPRVVERDAPVDGYGPDYFVFQLASDFHALCCLIGRENAMTELAEIVNYEHTREKRRGQ